MDFRNFAPESINMSDIIVPPSLQNLKDSDEVPLQDLYIYLKQFHLSESLYEIGSINAIFKYGFEKPVTTNIPERIIRSVNLMLAVGLHPQELVIVLSKLARFLLLSGANDETDHILVIGSQHFKIGYNAVRLVYDEDVESEFPDHGKTHSVVARLMESQRSLIENRLAIIARAFLVFKEIPSDIGSRYEFDEKMREYFSLSIDEFIWSGLAVWFITNGSMHITMENHVRGLKELVTRATIDKFVSLSTGTSTDYKKPFRGTELNTINKKAEYYALDPLIQMPIIKPQRLLRLSEGTLMVTQPKYLQDRTCNGIFHLLAKKEEDIAAAKGAKVENPFRRAFGDVFKEYVLRQLSSAEASIDILDLDKEFTHPNDKIPDIALINGNKCILLEVKTTLLNLSARMYFDRKDLEEALHRKKNNFEKAVHQLDAFSKSILNGSMSHQAFKNVNQVAKVLVCYDDIPFLNLLMLPLLEERFGIAAKNMQIATVTDIESIANTLHQEIDLPQIILNKIADPERRHYVLSVYLNNKYPHQGHNRLLHDTYRKVMESRGIPTKD